ncbi:hypothetical protein JQ628_07650 [Bradyrhizobium lablabi]|uniref:hypothetical protein n=1 Tax=Bradyrhizobium lablabi TaxID=722472 RepID=UPI001BACB4DA|nr:hypothetical protein [Bradyrhizobium lablabi]MBR1121386.1 hypothetical protein [Bradyrhizobium lablabi]
MLLYVVPMHQVVAILAFLVCYVIGFQIALAGPGNHDVFGWALLFGVALSIPSLFFVGLSYLLFMLIRWWATVLLSVTAIGVYAYTSGLLSEGWNMAFAVVIATIVYQLVLLLLSHEKRPARSHKAD